MQLGLHRLCVALPHEGANPSAIPSGLVSVSQRTLLPADNLMANAVGLTSIFQMGDPGSTPGGCRKASGCGPGFVPQHSCCHLDHLTPANASRTTSVKCFRDIIVAGAFLEPCAFYVLDDASEGASAGAAMAERNANRMTVTSIAS